MYVLPSGALSFAPAHSEGTPIIENGTTTGFTYVNATGTEDLGHFKFQGGDFLACPVGGESIFFLLCRDDHCYVSRKGDLGWSS